MADEKAQSDQPQADDHGAEGRSDVRLASAQPADPHDDEPTELSDVQLADDLTETGAAPSCPPPAPRLSAGTNRELSAAPTAPYRPQDQSPPPKRASPAPPPAPLAKGACIDDFEILSVLGRGAFGVVYLARQVSLDRQVALKVGMNRGSEGRTMARLEHQHIVQVFSEIIHAERNQRLLCMQLVPGTSLQQVISRLHRVPYHPGPWTGADILKCVDQATNVPAALDPSALHDREALSRMDATEATAWTIGRIAEALDHAHQQGVLHRDIKPANILVNQYGRPMLADFNISLRGRDEEAHADEGFGGTLAYMSPEHLDAFNPADETPAEAVNERSDVYSLGIVAWEMFTGRPPFAWPRGEANIVKQLSMLAEQRRVVPVEYPPGPAEGPKVLARTIGRALAPEPAERFASGGEMASALDGCRRLRHVERELPRLNRFGRAVLGRPLLWLVLLAVLPHVAASAVNIIYNVTQIVGQLSASQQQAFGRIVLAYNLLAYPLPMAVGWAVLVPVWRAWKKLCSAERVPDDEIDAARRRTVALPMWAAGLAVAGWLPGGVLFPWLIDWMTGPEEQLSRAIYGHFFVSFTLSGLIAVAYSFAGVQFVTLRAMYPRMWNNAANFVARARAELAGIPARLGWMHVLAGLIPLTGAVMVTLSGDAEGMAFRGMVTALILLGGAGYQAAATATRRLSRTLVALTEGEG